MIHLLLKRLATEPGLFTDHASAYAALIALEAGEAGLAWRRKAIATIGCAALGLLALSTTCLALMLSAAIPWQGMPAPWVLLAIPGTLWIASIAVGWAAFRRGHTQTFAHVRQQWAIDAQHVREMASTR